MIQIQLDSPSNETSVVDALLAAGLESILSSAGGGTITHDRHLSFGPEPERAMPELKHRNGNRMESETVIVTTAGGSEIEARAIQYDGEESPRFANGPGFRYLLHGVTSWRAAPVMEHSDHPT